MLVDVDEDVEGREASWRAMEVRGSCMDFRAVSRFLESALDDTSIVGEGSLPSIIGFLFLMCGLLSLL